MKLCKEDRINMLKVIHTLTKIILYRPKFIKLIIKYYLDEKKF